MKIKILWAVLLCMIFAVNGQYYNPCNSDYNCREGTGFFNSQLTNSTTATRALSSPLNIPLAADLDGNGDIELIAVDGNNIRIYEDITLNIVDTYTSSVGSYQYPVLFDIDGDGKTEIITAGYGTANAIQIIEYNGTAVYLQNNLSYGSGIYTGMPQIACANNKCVLNQASAQRDIASGFIYQYATAFNSTDTGDQYTITSWQDTAALSGIYTCNSKQAVPTAVDYNSYTGDGDTEYIFTYIKGSIHETVPASDKDYIEIRVLDVYDNLTLIQDQLISIDGGDLDMPSVVSTAYGCVNSNQSEVFTSPLVADLDQSLGNGYEFAIALHATPFTDFAMIAYDNTGTLLEYFPSVLNVNGRIMSNVYYAQVYDDSDTSKLFPICVNGWDEDDQEFKVLCGSLTDTWGLGFYNNKLFFLQDDDLPYNISYSRNTWQMISHAVDMSSAATPNNDEVLMTYGVLELDTETCNSITGNCDLSLIYNMDQQNGIRNAGLIPLDIQQVGRLDLAGITATNLWYIDDGFSNSGGELTYYSINPCLDATWKINESVNIQVKCEDIDGDNVFANATLYNGHPNEQSEVSFNASSGTTFSFGFEANQTIGSGNLQINCFDVQNPDDPDTYDLSFSVGTNGVTFGYCTTEFYKDLGTEAETGLISGTDVPVNNSISTAVDQVSSAFNLSPSILWLIIMFIVAGSVFFYGIQERMEVFGVLGIVLILEIFLLIIGAYLDFISAGIVITIAIMGLIVGSVYLARLIKAPA